MSLLSAVSAAGVLLTGVPAQNGLTAPLTQSLANRAAKSVVTLRIGEIPLGQAVVIGPAGETLTIGEVAFGPDGLPRKGLEAILPNGDVALATVEAFDPITDLAMVRIVGVDAGVLSPAKIASGTSGGVVLAVLPGGPARAELTRSDVTGVMAFSRRYVPLQEIRLERADATLGGAPIFDAEGAVVGILMASLSAETGSANKSADRGANTAANLAQAPRPLATTFSLGTSVLGRVVDGFTLNGGRVRHPYIGIYFSQNEAGLTVIDRVIEGGPSAKAGLQAGDIVLSVGDHTVTSHVDLAGLLFKTRIGAVLEFKVFRAGVAFKQLVPVLADPTSAAKADLKRLPIAQQRGREF
jgi:S1-C subfamily serine protease